MGSQPPSAADDTFAFFTYLGSVAFQEKEKSFNEYVAGHSELVNEGATVSPKVFQKLFEEHYEPINQTRSYIVQQLAEIWVKYAAIGKGNTADTPPQQQEEKKQGLKNTSDTGWNASYKFDGLLKRVTAVLVSCSTRVNWHKHHKNNYQGKLLKWLQEKDQLILGSLSDQTTVMIKDDVEAIRNGVALAMQAIVNPMPDKENGQAGKRPTDDEGGGPPSKKPKQHIDAGVWWGSKKEKLISSDQFNNIVRQYKEYLMANPDGAGSDAHRDQMIEFLRRGLESLNLQQYEAKLLLKSEWNFRDKNLSHVATPTFINPEREEFEWRLGKETCRGFNYFKQSMGGGLSAADESKQSNESGSIVSMGHASKALVIGGRVLGGRLLGGASPSKVSQNVSKTRQNARIATGLRWRDPSVLWEQFRSDSIYDPSFYLKAEQLRPAMMDPDRIGTAPMQVHMATMVVIPDGQEWMKILKENDKTTLQNISQKYLEQINIERDQANKFMHNNPGKFFPNEPKLNETGGRQRRRYRYDSMRDSDFARPIGMAFRARMYQIFRLLICWKLYLRGVYTLEQLLSEEKLNLEIWDQHEELYMEWENNRWFELSNEQELRELDNRYDTREWLRAKWVIERQDIDRTLTFLDANPGYFNSPIAAVQAPGGGLAVPSGGPSGPSGSPSGGALNPGGSSGPGGAVPNSPSGNSRLSVPPGPPSYSSRPPSYSPPPTYLAAPPATDKQVEMVDVGTDPEPEDENQIDKASDDEGRALTFLRKAREAYDERLGKAIEDNNALDDEDPGNHALIHRNNLDIMAKQQVIWALDSEIHNLQRSLDPLAKGNYGTGADKRWDLPKDEFYWRYTRRIPKPKQLPLGITSLGLGPMPGEHPAPDIPRILVGALEEFGKPAPKSTQEPNPAGSDLFGKGAGPAEAAPGSGQDPYQTAAGQKVPLQIADIPKDWPGFTMLHRVSWKKTEPSGTAALKWDDWVESVFLALMNSTMNYQQHFPDNSPYKLSDEYLRRHVEGLYRAEFNSAFTHNTMSWREREMGRHKILQGLSDEVNDVLASKGLPKTFAVPGILGPAPVSTAPATPAATQGLLDRLKDLIRRKTDAEREFRPFSELKNSSKKWTAKQEKALKQAAKARKEALARYKAVRNEADPATRAQADLLDQEAQEELKAELTAMSEVRQEMRKKIEAAQAAALKKSQAEQAEMLKKAQEAKDQAAKAAKIKKPAGDTKKAASQTQAQKKAEEEAQKAEAIIKQLEEEIKKAQADAKKAQADAKQAKAKAEAEAKKKAEEAALKVAEEQAKKVAEVDRKKVAEAFKKMLDEQAKKKAEYDAKRAAEAKKEAEEAKKEAEEAKKEAKEAKKEAKEAKKEAKEAKKNAQPPQQDVQQQQQQQQQQISSVQAQYYELFPGFDSWRAKHGWQAQADPGTVHNAWAAEVAQFMTAAYTIVTAPPVAAYGQLVVDSWDHVVRLWKTPAATPWEVTRQRWSHILIGKLNADARVAGKVQPFLSTPPLSPLPTPPITPSKKEPVPAEPVSPPKKKTEPAKPVSPPKRKPVPGVPVSPPKKRSVPAEPVSPPKKRPVPDSPVSPPKKKSVPDASGAPKIPGIPGSDAWPDLKDLLQATWLAIVAHDVLQQQPGNTVNIPSGRPGFPRPVWTTQRDLDVGDL
ncbi:hypothetical protein F5Y19DRAFT_5671 [Xylariaceae sp. FL1651]|nr:hypothetical protein F5Y19DRAFT_5671 [Xylariaceae sp. FL1651]